MSNSRDIADSAATINYIDTVTSNVQDQIDNLDPLPSQTGNTGKFLTTNGTAAAWDAVDVSSEITGTLPVANGGTGITAAGTSGNVLTSDGTNWASTAPAGGGSLLRTTVFTASGTWTKGADTTVVKVRVAGGGASGGGKWSSSQTVAGGGGGAGGYAEEVIDVTGTSSETVTVGSGGAEQSTSNTVGNSGGTSSFGSYNSCTGGTGGESYSGGGTGGIGGSATGGDLNIDGAKGGEGIGDTQKVPGSGGSSPFGGQGEPSTTSAPAATGYGSGGAGPYKTTPGGAGKAGIIIVEEFA